ncbi:hypothetical protein ACFQ3P_08765 [Paraburkholderia sabiae]|uniref:Uncharacterized protein n=1 Tax=Paraburkholderia sabiae TaxID=273251 RepID=A0ABU9Q4P0_9BURK|nr:hypothetical protein [Paraburkholderia sabiae]WJZ71876.1 hypothetical protein QEN71_16975 [Paraburkholderia sabiae]
MVGRFRTCAQVERSGRATNTEAIDSPYRQQEEPRMEQNSKSAYEADARVHEAHRERLMDEALMDTFPASDPIPQMCFD